MSTSTYSIEITCPVCAGPLEMVNQAVSGGGTLSVAILACHPCHAQWEVAARLARHSIDPRSTERRAKNRELARAGG